MDVRGRKVVVVGAARSGVAATRLLLARGARVTLTDRDPAVVTRPDVAALARDGADVHSGPGRPGEAAGADLLVVSPGVPASAPPAVEARAAGVPVIGEMELGARFARGRLLAITGSNGKSTTTTLAARMLAAAGLDVRAGGNLGTPLCTAVLDGETEQTVHCLEVSSFQAETLDQARFEVVTLLNVTADHLDRYPSLADYAEAKLSLFDRQQADGVAVLGAADPTCRAAVPRVRGRVTWFGLSGLPGEGLRLDGRAVAVSTLGGCERDVFKVADLWTSAPHHVANALAAAATCLVAGIPEEAVARGIAGFCGLPHRGEEIPVAGGRRFVNDSKATNVESAVTSIRGAGAGVVAILGGRHKGGDLTPLAEALRAARGTAVLIGESTPVFRSALAGRVPTHEAGTLGEAVELAAGLCGPAGTVLLAPACASFDMFSDYAHRGDSFRHEVLVRFGAARPGGGDSPSTKGCAA